MRRRPWLGSGWSGLFAPAGTPPGVVALLNAVCLAGVAQPEMRRRMQASGMVLPAPMDAPRAHAYVAQQAAYWRGVIREIGMKMDG